MARSVEESPTETHEAPEAHRVLGASRVAGYSMVELLLVLTVVAVMTSIAAPAFFPGRWRADAAVQEVMATLSATQRFAVLRQHDLAVTFLETERSLEVHRDEDNDGVVDAGEDVRRIELPETVGFGVGSAPTMRGDPATSTVTFADPGAGPRLVFHRNGAASQAGRIYLRPHEGSLASDAIAARALEVTRSTGEIRCFSYRSGSWEGTC